MLNNNHKNSDCGYGEALVSYLYGEATERETATLKAHLESCRACADEMAAFSGVHLAIDDWKLKDFAMLATPAIEIPYEKAENPTAASSVRASWLPAFLRGLFSTLSPRGWTLATASLAVLAVCTGIVLFALNSRTREDIAGNEKNSKPTVVPTAEKSPEQSSVVTNRNTNPEKEINPSNEQKARQPEVVVSKSESENKRVVKAVNNPRSTPKVDNTPQTRDLKRNNKNNTELAPKAIPDEEEDDTLRLAELFEEIDTKE
jgi:hypothetical protein